MLRLIAVGLLFFGALNAQEAALFKDGDLAFSKGDYDGARESFEKALAKAAPDSAASYDLLKRLTSASVAAGRFADAQG